MRSELTKVMYAANDGEYEQLKQAFLDGLADYPVQEIHDHYMQNTARMSLSHGVR